MSRNKETKLCKHCKSEIPAEAKVCPSCQKKQGGITKWVIIAAGIIVIGAFASIGNSDNDNKDNQIAANSENTKTPSGNSSVNDNDKTKNTDITKQPSDNTTSESEDNNEKESNIPTEYKSALNSAETYSDMMNMSKAAIYDQLISEYGDKFTKKAAKYAIDNLDADWNKNALKTAETYSDTMNMSKTAIYDQLISKDGNKFTKKQAKYAIEHLK